MAILLNDGIKVQGGKPVEDKRLNNGVPYTSVDQVNSLIIPTDRYISLEVLINDKIYWYKDGIEDNNLVEKLEGSQSKDLIKVTVDTPSTTKDKIGTTTAGNYVPQEGDELVVDFVEGSWVNSPTLNIDGSGVKNIMLSGRNPDRNNLSIGNTGQDKTVRLWYDGTNYQLYGATINTTYGVIPQQALENENNNSSYLISGAVVAWIRNWENIIDKPDLVTKEDIQKVIDVTTIDSTGNFKSGSGSIIPHISNNGVFSIHAGEIGSGDLIIEAKKSGVTIPKYLHVKHIRAEKLRISKSGSTWLDMDSRNNELNVFIPSNENVYVPVKASGFKVPNGNKGKVFASDGSQLLFTKGVDVSTSTYQPNNNHIESSTIFLTGGGDKTINLHELENHTVLSFKKCYDGGTIMFVCNGKTLVIRGADAFNGKDGSNAVISIVNNKCYIDINNYE